MWELGIRGHLKGRNHCIYTCSVNNFQVALVKVIRLLMLTLSTGFFLFDNVASTKHLVITIRPWLKGEKNPTFWIMEERVWFQVIKQNSKSDARPWRFDTINTIRDALCSFPSACVLVCSCTACHTHAWCVLFIAGFRIKFKRTPQIIWGGNGERLLCLSRCTPPG